MRAAAHGCRAPGAGKALQIGNDVRVRAEDFERLYAEHAQPLFGFLHYRTGDRVLAEDLMADTFERAFRARARFDRRRASEKTWIYTIALNCLRDQSRRRAVEQRTLERVAAGGPEQVRDTDAEVTLRDLIRRGLAVLSEEEREAVALRFGADLTVPEMAKLLDEPLTTLEGRVYRALRKLREELS